MRSNTSVSHMRFKCISCKIMLNVKHLKKEKKENKIYSFHTYLRQLTWMHILMKIV